ncbi:hypothetical protein R3P38DRAFT_2903679 [Favolaschia claudopus]|uniref:Uncharacterized protein n=1 Tax=Favolaschia claudopus TaxID=2862362 RepID=A0AAW0CFL7_9AGAR
MFTDVCLSCGKELDDDRAFCDEQCKQYHSSPDLSDASSPFDSPHLRSRHSDSLDVPALVPSALGRALRAYTASASSSSASTSSYSALTDTDTDEDELDLLDDVDYSPRHNTLSYARRPSQTNHPRPSLHCRTASSSSDTDPDDPARTLRKRSRASLPTYFSMLQIASSSSKVPPSSKDRPMSPSSSITLTRRSPPTPKLTVVAGLAAAVAQSHTPRGRRRISPTPRIPHHLQPSPSRSRSPSPGRRRTADEKVADWSSALALGNSRARGRASVRRSCDESDFSMIEHEPMSSRDPSTGTGAGSRSRTRGRARVDELEGPADTSHPGFGFGRSGLVGRARKGPDGEWLPVR